MRDLDSNRLNTLLNVDLQHLKLSWPLDDSNSPTTFLKRRLNLRQTDATHLILSAGGNDALECIPIVRSPVPDSTDLLTELVAMQSDFRVRYQQLISSIRKTRLPAIGCTIYDAVPGVHPIERMTLSLFKDIIVRELVAVHLPVLELRMICSEFRDYSAVSPIEPSEIGGTKIVRAIQHVLLGHDFSRIETAIYH